jgi:hypothetical protein
VLLIDDVDVGVWLPWIQKCPEPCRPKCIVWTGPSKFITNESDGPVGKLVRKQSLALGYRLDYWILASEHYGAAISQDRLVVVCTLGRMGPWLSKPLATDLPPRNMSNLLQPVGVPLRRTIRESLVFSRTVVNGGPATLGEAPETSPFLNDLASCWIGLTPGSTASEACGGCNTRNGQKGRVFLLNGLLAQTDTVDP